MVEETSHSYTTDDNDNQHDSTDVFSDLDGNQTLNLPQGANKPNEVDISVHLDAFESNTIPNDPTLEVVPVFQAPVIKKQLDALSLKYEEPVESDICDIPIRGDSGSQERQNYIDACFQVWDIHSRFVRTADRITTVLKIAHMSDLYVLYLLIEEDVTACPSIETSRGRDIKSIVYDKFCEALPETHRKNSKSLKADAEKCFAFLMTTGAQKIYDTPTISYESVRRLKAARVKTLLEAIEKSGTTPNFGDYKTLVAIPRRITTVPRPLADPVVPTDSDVVQKLLEEKKRRLRSHGGENKLNPKLSKRIRIK
jgi:hypothetical protein